ncbi:NB-ARC domains-containing protein [Tanacetum coccineum]
MDFQIEHRWINGENLVGIDFHFDKLDLSRFVGSDKVNMIGICGISGIGKTTITKAIYNLMYVHFEGSCFCEDVKEVTKRQGVIQVQMHLINKILKTEDQMISCVSEGSTVIKQRMACKPIMLVLDDSDHGICLKALAGSDIGFAQEINMKVLIDKSLITISSDMSLQMHEFIEAMTRGILREESIMRGKQIRLWSLSEVYDLLSGKKVEITEAVEVLVLFLEKSSQKVHLDATEITNLEELDLEGCVNLVTVHPSIEMLKRHVVLNMTNCKLEVLHELPPSLYIVSADDCTSLCSITRSSKDPFKITDLDPFKDPFKKLEVSAIVQKCLRILPLMARVPYQRLNVSTHL